MPLARRIVHWLSDKPTLKGETKMSNITRENKLRILGVMGDNAVEIAYCIDSGAHEIISAEKLLLTPAKFYLIEKAATSSEFERRNLIHEVIRLGFVIVSDMSTELLRSEAVSCAYNVIRDRYCLPIPMAVVSEALYAEERFQSFITEVNDVVTKVNFPEENNDGNNKDKKELIPETEKSTADYMLRPIMPVEAYDKNITITAKGLSKEQCDKLVALAVTYIAENNSASSTNHSSLTIE